VPQQLFFCRSRDPWNQFSVLQSLLKNVLNLFKWPKAKWRRKSKKSYEKLRRQLKMIVERQNMKTFNQIHLNDTRKFEIQQSSSYVLRFCSLRNFRKKSSSACERPGEMLK
jgi:hypothetical protein